MSCSRTAAGSSSCRSESPLHVGHCKLIYDAALMGAVICPPMPAFYNNPQSIDDIVNHTIGRVLDLLGIDSDLVKRWTGVSAKKVQGATGD